MSYKASAPGSLMLFGEYAVLYGKPALVCAVDKRISVQLTPRSDSSIVIESELHGRYETDLTNIQLEKPFHFVLGALRHYQPKMRRGCDLYISSEFSDKVGLGSSAAVTVATLAALISWLNIRASAFDLIRQGRNVIREVQGVGSGADIAASVYGGMVAYQGQPVMAEKLTAIYPLTVLYAGYKTPTVQAIKQVQDHFADHPNLFKSLHQGIGQCAVDGIQFVRKENWQQVGKIMNVQQGMMEALGVSSLLLREMVDDLRKQPGIMGAKISGSGWGDCVVALGSPGEDSPFFQACSADLSAKGVQQVPVSMTVQGVQCEKI